MTGLLACMTLSPVQSPLSAKLILASRARVQEWRTTNNIKYVNGGLCQTRGQLFERVTVKDILWYPQEMVPILVVAENSKSPDKNDGIFKHFYFPFFHFFCKIKIWLHDVTPLDFHVLWVSMADPWNILAQGSAQVWKLNWKHCVSRGGG